VHRPFRGLLSVHSRYGPHTRAATNSWHAYPKASDISSPPCLLRLLPAGAVAGRGLHPLESAAFARRTPTAAGLWIKLLAKKPTSPISYFGSAGGPPHWAGAPNNLTRRYRGTGQHAAPGHTAGRNGHRGRTLRTRSSTSTTDVAALHLYPKSLPPRPADGCCGALRGARQSSRP